MRWFLVFWLCFPLVSFARVNVCNDDGYDGAQYFMSPWYSDGFHKKVLSSLDKHNFAAVEGRVVSYDDLNGDGVDDYVFVSSKGERSGKELAYHFLVRCKGYLRRVGGGDFVDIKVLPGYKGDVRSIVTYSYRRDAKGRVQSEEGGMLVVSKYWRFNYATKLYEQKNNEF